MANDDYPELVAGDEPFAELVLPHEMAARRREADEAFYASSNVTPQAIGCVLSAILAKMIVIREPRLKVVASAVAAPIAKTRVEPSLRLMKTKHPRRMKQQA